MAQGISPKPLALRGRSLLGLLVSFAVGTAVGVFMPQLLPASMRGGDAPYDVDAGDKLAEKEIRRLYDLEHDLLLRRDFAAQERFYPEDFVVTNPFNMFINKQKVMERLRDDIIKYSTYERQYDYFHRYGDTAVMVGSEMVVPTPDAKRPDAGKTVHRRFTEVWVHRNGGWQKTVRHASNVTPP